MNRLNFLKKMGLSGAALMAVLTSCQEKEITPTGPVDFDVDLTDIANAPLFRPGGYIVRNGVVVARQNHSKFVAVTQTCSHERLQQVTFQNGEFYCTAHGARFDTLGKGLNEEGKRGLIVYKIEQTGATLRVYS
jgi:cytochrome b6-f complex iron-sulfur subunit